MSPSSCCQEQGFEGGERAHSREGPAAGPWLVASPVIPDPQPAQDNGCCIRGFLPGVPFLDAPLTAGQAGREAAQTRRGWRKTPGLGVAPSQTTTADHSSPWD